MIFLLLQQFRAGAYGFLLCDVMNLLHYTLMVLYDYCPIEDTAQCV